ncbi:MAG: helix-turn-helix domain-containing protein [Solirubrobacteraceae bacterium]
MSRARHYCGCGSPLARDNADGLCSACQARRRRDRAPEVPPEFWQAELMGDALASGDLGRVVRAYRSHPFHGQPLPQSIVAGWLHVSQTTLSRIEQGTRRLTIDDISGFTRALGMPMALRWVPLQPSQAGEDVDPISRRSLFGAGVGAALGLNATTAPAAARDIDPHLVRHWMDLMGLLYRHDAMFGSHDVLAPVRHELDLIAAHRQVARGDLRDQLLRVESRWALFASWLGHDTGDSLTRDYWADRALRLAQESGYHDMVAWTLLRQSQWAATRDDRRRAIVLADAAGSTRETSTRIRALCALRLAHAHALANDAASCERSLADARAGLLARADTNTDNDPCDDLGRRDVTAPYLLAAEARCWLGLRPRQAIAMLEEVLRLWPRHRTRGHGVHRARLALACAAADEPERAATEGFKALEIARTTRSDVTVRELQRLDRRLATCDLPAAADFREALAAL